MSINYAVGDHTEDTQMVLTDIECTLDLQVLGGHGASERCANIVLSLLQMVTPTVSISLSDIYGPQHMFLRLERGQLTLSFSYGPRKQSYTGRQRVHSRSRAEFYSQTASAMRELCEFGSVVQLPEPRFPHPVHLHMGTIITAPGLL